VANSLTNRTHSILLICALLAVLVTCAFAVARVSLAGASPVCHGLSADASAPVGYRLP
jgi:membrane associated rhomboid family serine protease